MNRNARRLVRVVAAALLLLVLVWFYRQQQKQPRRLAASGLPPPAAASNEAGRPPSAMPGRPERLIGERILNHYADPARRPEDDLTDLAHALGNFALLVKGDNPLPLGANEEIAAALRGKNRMQLRFLPDRHPAFNAQGQLVDRWGTPLYFHAIARDRIDVRSAGPDKLMWTDDDIHRRYDGRFLKGQELLAPSLFDGVQSKR